MKAIKIVISITIPFFLIILFASLLTTKPYLMFSKGKYQSHTHIVEEHDYGADRVIGYLNYRYDNLYFKGNPNDIDYLLDFKSIDHMVDVKDVYTYLRLIALGCLIVAVSLSILLYKKDKKELYKTFKFIYVGPALFVSFVGGYILIDFNAAFTAFHGVFFPQGGWTLDYDSFLIRLLPTAFWMVSGIILLVLFSLSMGLIYILNEKFMKKYTLN